MSKIRVLIVDDSSVVRMLLKKLLESDPQIEVVGSAPDPYVARELLYELKPDVMTLDIEMPRMDGLSFLDVVMKHNPIRTIILSSLTEKNSALALDALRRGALEVVAKPKIEVQDGFAKLQAELVTLIKAIASRQVPSLSDTPVKKLSTQVAKLTTGVRIEGQILAIAASTGGTEALKKVLRALPAEIPGTVIVQHMPPVFTKAYANSLSQLCAFPVREAIDGERVIPGQVLLAPGDFHLEIVKSGGVYFTKLHTAPPLHGVRPAADFLLKSVAKYAGKNAIGVVLTGMGRDGAEGLLAMRQAGAFTLAQDEASCVVFGMPKAAIEMGAAQAVRPLDSIAATVFEKTRKHIH